MHNSTGNIKILCNRAVSKNQVYYCNKAVTKNTETELLSIGAIFESILRIVTLTLEMIVDYAAWLLTWLETKKL